MNWIIIPLIAALVLAAGYFLLLHLGKITDKDKDLIPDAVENAAKEVADRVDRVAKEIADAIDAAKGKKEDKK
jgi:hypothetical protein